MERTSIGILVDKLDDFIQFEGNDLSNRQYEFLNDVLLKELCKCALDLGEMTDTTVHILNGNI